jgi:4,5:9,10-diseco-3-hydroxy-5,9,17-trioxoandrosta-1(10),2-diene-4-oate hydrolase
MPEDRFVLIDNLKMRYWSAGSQDKTIVLVHGLGAAADIWIHNIEVLAENHRVIVPDLPGFGKSDLPPPSFSPFDYTSFLAGLIDTITNGPVTLVGQSLGGAVVLDYALQHGDKVDRLVLVDSAGLGVEVIWSLRFLSLPLLGELLTCYPTRKGVEIFFKLAVCNPALVTRQFVDSFYHYYTRPGFRTFFLRLLRQLVNIRSVRQEALAGIAPNLGKITKPVLIVWGEEDHVLPLKHAYTTERLLPHSFLKTMKDCGHLPFLEYPDEFNRLVLKFLDRH